MIMDRSQCIELKVNDLNNKIQHNKIGYLVYSTKGFTFEKKVFKRQGT